VVKIAASARRNGAAVQRLRSIVGREPFGGCVKHAHPKQTAHAFCNASKALIGHKKSFRKKRIKTREKVLTNGKNEFIIRKESKQRRIDP
jgi:hypothetical protein